MTICVKCAHCIEYDRDFRWLPELCAKHPHKFVPGLIDPVTGCHTSGEYRTLNGTHANYSHELCRAINHGDCPDFYPNWWERLKARVRRAA